MTLPITVPSTPRPTEIPGLLPRTFLPDLLIRHQLVLFLDYDGTISDITPALFEARPVPRARELIARLAMNPERVWVAIITGREIDDVTRLLGINDNLFFGGAHGLEVMHPNQQRWLVADLKACVPELQKL